LDRKTLTEFYRAYGPAVKRRARILLGNEQAAEDALHEVFMRVIQHGDAFRGESSPMTWLYRITTNHCLNIIRDSNNRRRLLRAQGTQAGAVPPQAEAQLAFHQILARLPDELREIAVYYYVDEMNHDEIATLLGVSRRTIGNRLTQFRALTQRDETSEHGQGLKS
jgi:RNA polymerase sigma-70 factor (ECF subfamily)